MALGARLTMDEKIERLSRQANVMENMIARQSAYIETLPVEDFHQDAWLRKALQNKREAYQELLNELADVIAVNQSIKLESGLVVVLNKDDHGRLSVEIIE
jgi:hypothetical protein